MALIGLLSDTHSVLDARIFTHFTDCDEVWHAGDFGSVQVVRQLQAFKPLRGVYGNVDAPEIRAVFAEDLRFEIEGVPVFMTHIGGYPGKYAPRVRKLLTADPPRGGLFICGHSHILKVMYDHKGEFLHLNPGACGNEGWHKVKTLLRFQVNSGRVHDLELIELGGRTQTG